MMNYAASTSVVSWLGSTLLATATFWIGFGACVIDTKPLESEPQARIAVGWNALACGQPHRVVVELEDDAGVPVSASAPCEIGRISLDVRHWGIYRGRVYAWTFGPEIRSVAPVRLEVDAPVIYWTIETPQ